MKQNVIWKWSEKQLFQGPHQPYLPIWHEFIRTKWLKELDISFYLLHEAWKSPFYYFYNSICIVHLQSRFQSYQIKRHTAFIHFCYRVDLTARVCVAFIRTQLVIAVMLMSVHWESIVVPLEPNVSTQWYVQKFHRKRGDDWKTNRISSRPKTLQPLYFNLHPLIPDWHMSLFLLSPSFLWSVNLKIVIYISWIVAWWSDWGHHLQTKKWYIPTHSI